MATCIVIPAFDAAGTILGVAREALRTGLPVLVVDDGSRDGTAEKLSGLPLSVISLGENRGKGAALKAGFRWALANRFDGVITVDADGQHDVAAAPLLARAGRDDGFHILIASRESQFKQMAGLRSGWNRFGVWCVQKRTGFAIDDCQSGFRYYSGALLRQLKLEGQGYDLEMEVLLKAWRGGLKVGTLPVPPRVADGRPTSHYRPIRDTWKICMTFLRYM
ncbi:glycosyl transferase family 2 [Geomonas sp. Red276]